MTKLLGVVAGIYFSFLVILVATAQETTPIAPVPPLETWHSIVYYTGWVATCESEKGPYPCWVYTVTRRQETDCARADIDGNGVVGLSDFNLLSKNYGCWAEEE